MRHLPFSRRAITLFTGVVVAAGPFVGRAYADMQNATFYGGSAFFKESHRDEGNGMVGLWDVEVRRVLQFKNVWEQICDYQAQVKVGIPQGKVYEDFSSFHEGCNPNGGPAWFSFPQFGDKENHDNYPKGSLIEAYWKDNHTGGEFRKIGSQRL